MSTEENLVARQDEGFSLLESNLRKNSFGYRSIEVRGDDRKLENDEEEDADHSSGEDDAHDKTNLTQTFVHLLKGYMGAGCLSLPWALSQLGLFYGSVAIFVVSFWSSLNCWTIVKLKRFIEKESINPDDKASEASSVTTNTQVTYADVGLFFYGSRFETYVAACVCTQQLAICTVFISFVGENLLAVSQHIGWRSVLATHTGVMTIELPFIIGLCLIPSLKSLTPAMTAGTVLLVVTFFSIGVIIQKEWDIRPMEAIELDLSQAPLAVSAILYSYEGINLILPVESSMLDPKNFKIPFVAAMASVACILVSFALVCVLAFGYVDNGSVTAFLIRAYPDDPDVTWWVMVANASVSLSVLLTYPLQLLPALQLLAPPFSNFVAKLYNLSSGVSESGEDDLSAFEPLPPLPEHDVPPVEEWDEHHYNAQEEDDDQPETQTKDGGESNSVTYSAITSIQSIFPEMTMPGDSPLLRISLVLLTFAIAVAVPNVQALISLAGALAGSSSALLIPPLLELAWIAHLEGVEDSDTTEPQSRWATILPGTEQWGLGRLWFDKLKCYVLFALGFLFFGIGTYASLADIVRIYSSD